DIEEVTPPSGWRAAVAGIRSGLAQLAAPLSPAARGLVPGIALGDTRMLPARLKTDPRTTSLTPLSAISGAHVALGLAVVLRAGVMGAVMLLGIALRRPRTGLPALCCAVVVLIAADPWIARSYGFALSVLATSGLLLVAPWLVARTTAVLPRALAIALIVPLAAQLACLPVLVLLQPQLPVYGVAANILAAPVVAPATILGVLAALLAPHWPAVAVVLLRPAAWCAEWVATVATTLAGLPGAAVAWPVAALAGGVLLVAVLLLGRRRLIAR